jgi:hypothetical protein
MSMSMSMYLRLAEMIILMDVDINLIKLHKRAKVSRRMPSDFMG